MFLFGSSSPKRAKHGDRNFILCLGAQRCGTTWLHDYLNSHSFADFGFSKEYHVFNITHVKYWNRAREKAFAQLKDDLDRQPVKIRHLVIKRANFIVNPDSYFDYFAGLRN